jgi:predicted naringenin-chalcone synthase
MPRIVAVATAAPRYRYAQMHERARRGAVAIGTQALDRCLSCAGLAPGHGRASLEHRALIAAVEICSAAYYCDGTVESVVGEAIFADGAGASCLAEDDSRPGLMGFDFPGGCRRLVLSKDVWQTGARMLEELAGDMLSAHNLKHQDIRFWIPHSAGCEALDNAQTLQ